MASVFSGKTGRDTAVWTAQKAEQQLDDLKAIYGQSQVDAGNYLTTAFGQGQGYLKNAFDGSRDTLRQGRTSAAGYLNQGMDQALAQSNAGYNQARNDITGALGTATGQLQGGYADALASLQSLYGQAAGVGQQAADAFNPLVDRAMSGYDMYNNSLGLNGAEGRAAAMEAFQEGPGYQYQVDQTLSQAARAANKMGGSALGGNSRDTMGRLASNLANQEFGGWQDRLQGFQGAAQSAVSGRAAALANLASIYENQGNQTSDLQAQQGRDLSSLTTNAGSALSGLAMNNGQFNAGVAQQGNAALATNSSNFAQALANLRTQYGQNQTNLGTSYGSAMAGLSTGTAQGIADATNNYYNTVTSAGQQGFQAGQQAAGNRFGALMGGLQLGANLLGAGSSGGFLNLFGGKG